MASSARTGTAQPGSNGAGQTGAQLKMRSIMGREEEVARQLSSGSACLIDCRVVVLRVKRVVQRWTLHSRHVFGGLCSICDWRRPVHRHRAEPGLPAQATHGNAEAPRVARRVTDHQRSPRQDGPAPTRRRAAGASLAARPRQGAATLAHACPRQSHDPCFVPSPRCTTAQSQAMDNITTGFIREPNTLELEWGAVVQGLLDALHNNEQAVRLMPSALKGAPIRPPPSAAEPQCAHASSLPRHIHVAQTRAAIHQCCASLLRKWLATQLATCDAASRRAATSKTYTPWCGNYA